MGVAGAVPKAVLARRIIIRILMNFPMNQPSRTKNRFLRVTIAIIATFVLTWLPYQVFALLRVLCSEDTPCSRVAERLNWLQAAIIASACINPFLYRFRTRPVSSGSAINTTADRMSSYKDIKESHSSYQLRNRLAIDECRPKRGDSSMNLTALRIADESSLLGTHGDLPKRATSALALSTLSPANKDTSDDCHNV
uniref:G-protein coupled receptors family 1 profile domain-containing protein n=1 Tax=Plectus sambesii TaxID=2011161 RepID=A0A914X2J7_9BILA